MKTPEVKCKECQFEDNKHSQGCSQYKPSPAPEVKEKIVATCLDCKSKFTQWISESTECPECEGYVAFDRDFIPEVKEKKCKCIKHNNGGKEVLIVNGCPIHDEFFDRNALPEPIEEKPKHAHAGISTGNCNICKDYSGNPPPHVHPTPSSKEKCKNCKVGACLGCDIEEKCDVSFKEKKHVGMGIYIHHCTPFNEEKKSYCMLHQLEICRDCSVNGVWDFSPFQVKSTIDDLIARNSELEESLINEKCECTGKNFTLQYIGNDYPICDKCKLPFTRFVEKESPSSNSKVEESGDVYVNIGNSPKEQLKRLLGAMNCDIAKQWVDELESQARQEERRKIDKIKEFIQNYELMHEAWKTTQDTEQYAEGGRATCEDILEFINNNEISK